MHTRFASALLLMGIITGCGDGDSADSKKGTTNSNGSPVGETTSGGDTFINKDDPLGESVRNVVFLDQGWISSLRKKFYTTSQGSQILPYEWFLALEQADSTTAFRDDLNILRFRYLPQSADAKNPDALPVGFVADSSQNRKWLGLTCAACHTNEIRYGTTAYRIDGAPTLGDIRALLSSLIEAMQKTHDDPDKFGRFAVKVLVKHDSPTNRNVLKKRMEVIIQARIDYNLRNFPGYDPKKPSPPPDDYGRLDAFGAIINEVYFHAEKPPSPATATSKPANAPVSYPFLWDTNGQNLVQWVGLPNGGLNTLARNVGEVLGVFAEYKIPDEHFLFGYPSSVRVASLLEIQDWLGDLRPPPWPVDFPPINKAAAEKGKVLYQNLCLKCHVLIDPTARDRTNTAFMGGGDTDPATYNNIFQRSGPTGKLQGTFANVVDVTDETRIAVNADALTMVRNEVIGTIIGDWKDAPTDLITGTDLRKRPAKALVVAPAESQAHYKARALNGIWATAPYLHNGSVPNLRELLLPASQRSKSFSIGVRTFDPEKVGYLTDVPNFPKFRVVDANGKTIPGNSNVGHEYGINLTDDERAQLLAYLKTL